ncbi:hypothetical protein [Pseudoxanthomonas wuyuanensis]
MSAPPCLFAPLALLCLGAISLAHARDAQTSLGIRLVIVDSCDIHSGSGPQQPDGDKTRVECRADTPYQLSLSHPVPSADAMASQRPAPAVSAAPEGRPAVPQAPRRDLHGPDDIPTTTVIF